MHPRRSHEAEAGNRELRANVLPHDLHWEAGPELVMRSVDEVGRDAGAVGAVELDLGDDVGDDALQHRMEWLVHNGPGEQGAGAGHLVPRRLERTAPRAERPWRV